MDAEHAPQQERRPRTLVGLRYEPARGLPSVVLKANGERAEAILARRPALTSAPVVRDAELARALYRLPIDAPIRRELFTAVAAVLVHVFSIEATLEAGSHA